jgi:hypothetical protein
VIILYIFIKLQLGSGLADPHFVQYTGMFRIADPLLSLFYSFVFSDGAILSRLWCDNRQSLDW